MLMVRKFIHDHQILVAAVILAAGLWLMYLRKPSQAPPDRSAELAAKDETIRAIKSERDVYRAWKDEAVAEKQKADSLLNLKDKATIVKYATIPVYINSLNRDSLRAEVLRFTK
jgi:hypothetical protein